MIMTHLSGPSHKEEWNNDQEAAERHPENHVRVPEHFNVTWRNNTTHRMYVCYLNVSHSLVVWMCLRGAHSSSYPEE